MYTLRNISDNVQTNTNLGNEYQLIEIENNYDDFSRTFKIFFDCNHLADLDEDSSYYTKNCYAFVVFE